MKNVQYFGTSLLLSYQVILITCMAVEPQCHSRFDYEYKVVQKIVALENMCEELKNTNKELRLEIAELSAVRTDANPVPVVAFLAVLNQQRLSVATKTTIVFDTTVTNIGDGYNSNDGVFTVPYDGIYSFSAAILADNSGEVWSKFSLNGNTVAHIYARGTDGRHDQGANTVILQLKKGDRVYVENENIANTIYGERYSSFSGSLLGVQP